MSATIFHRQDRDTGEVSTLTETELRGYLQAHRAPVGLVLRELAEGMVLEQQFFNYAANPLLFKAVARKPAEVRTGLAEGVSR